MKKLANGLMLTALALVFTGCARPWEVGWTPAYSGDERGKLIARNWDMEGKQSQDDLDHALLLRPMGQLSIWNIR
jgi:hypothetical protein